MFFLLVVKILSFLCKLSVILSHFIIWFSTSFYKPSFVHRCLISENLGVMLNRQGREPGTPVDDTPTFDNAAQSLKRKKKKKPTKMHLQDPGSLESPTVCYPWQDLHQPEHSFLRPLLANFGSSWTISQPPPFPPPCAGHLGEPPLSCPLSFLNA